MEPMIQEERAFSKMRTSAVQRLQNHLPGKLPLRAAHYSTVKRSVWKYKA